MTKQFLTDYNDLIETKHFTKQELDLVCKIIGKDIIALQLCVWAKYGVRSVRELIKGY